MPGLKLFTLGSLSLVCSLFPTVADAVTLESQGYVIGETDISPAVPTGDIAYAGNGFFVAIGDFGAATQQIIRVAADGTQTTVATQLNSVAGIVFDAASGSLFFVDNGGEQAGSTTGDTVYELPNALSATATDASTLEIAAAGSIVNASRLVLADSDTLLVTNSVGSPGTVEMVDIVTGSVTTVINDLGYASGIQIGPDGNLFVGDVDATSFAGSVREYSMDLSGPTFAFVGYLIEGAGSADHAFDGTGALLLTGGYGGDFTSIVDSIDSNGTSTPLASGFGFSGGIGIDPISGQVGVVEGYCQPADEPCTAVANLTPLAGMTGLGRGRRDCNASLFGGVETKNARGRGKNLWECTEGDVSCDRDGAADGTCTFVVGGCVGLVNPDNTACQADLDTIEIRRRPKMTSDGGFPALQANMDLILGGGPACSQAVEVQVAKAKRTTIRLKARKAGKVVDRDTLSLRCR